MTLKERKNQPMQIAITGIGGMFPGCDNLNDFYNLLKDGRSAAAPIPKDRWSKDPATMADSSGAKPDKVLSDSFCALKRVPEDFSDIKNLEANFIKDLDPLFKVALRAGKDAFDDANTANINKDRIQVIIANIALPTDTLSQITQDFAIEIIKSRTEGRQANFKNFTDVSPYNRLSADLPASLIAIALGITGGAYTVDAACASSIYAIKLASEELLSGRADAVISGGISRPSSQFTQMGFSQLRALSPSGVCRPFDANGDGLIVGEGAGFFILKRLEDAIAAKDHIYGIIQGIGLSNDVGGSLIAPDSEGQLRAVRAAYKQAGWLPSDAQYIECHGTGTPKGDLVELETLKTIFDESKASSGDCYIGSVKANVGHLLTGAGAAGLMKLLTGLKHKEFFPNANFTAPNPNIDLSKTPIKFLKEAKKWEPRNPGEPRKCALSAFGFGGINGHLLLEEYLESKQYNISRQEPHEPRIAIVAADAWVGDAKNLSEFQESLFNCATLKKDFPENSKYKEISDFAANHGAQVAEIPVTPGEFKLSPLEIPDVLPQQLLMLKTVKGALNRLTGKTSSPMNWGAYIGISQDFEAGVYACRWNLAAELEKAGLTQYTEAELLDSITPPLSHTRTIGALGGIVASRVAREFKIGGQAHTFSNDENSGLSALEAAVKALQRGEVDTAVVGAVDFGCDPRNIYTADKLRSFSTKHSTSVPFDKTADGAFPTDGSVCLILKTEEQALKDGDRIYALIDGISKSNSLHLNDSESLKKAYTAALNKAWNESGMELGNIGALETSASGNSELDKLEAEAIAASVGTAKKNVDNQYSLPTAITNSTMTLGNTGAAKGLFSLASAAVSLDRRILPAVKILEQPINATKELECDFFTPNKPQYRFRNRINGPMTTGVSSIANNGTVYHAVLSAFEETEKLSETAIAADKKAAITPLGDIPEALFVLGGTTTCDLRERVAALGKIEADSVKQLAREYFETYPFQDKGSRLAVVADSLETLRERLSAVLDHLKENAESRFINPKYNDKIFFNPKPAGTMGKTAFVFPGSGNHYFGMGSDLFINYPEELNRLDKECELLSKQFAPDKMMPWRLAYGTNWEKQAKADTLADHNSMVFSHVALCAYLSNLTESFGITPDIIMGYSLGETAGNFATKTWRERDEMVRRLIASTLFTHDLIGEYNAPRQHWNLPADEKITWVLGVANVSKEKAEKHLSKYDQAYVLIRNTPDECVIGGNKPQVDALIKDLGCAFFELDGVSSVHCPASLPASDRYRALHLYDCYPPENIQFISSGEGVIFTPEKDRSADSIYAQCVGMIDFPKCLETAYEAGARVFLELGPKASMTRMINSILKDRPHFARAMIQPGQNENASLIRFLGNIAAEGLNPELARLYTEKETVAVKASAKPIIRPVANVIKPFKIKTITAGKPQNTVTGHKTVAVSATQSKAPKASAPVSVSSAAVQPVLEQQHETFAKPATAIQQPQTAAQPQMTATSFSPKQTPAAANQPPYQNIPLQQPNMNMNNNMNPLLQAWFELQEANVQAHAAFLEASASNFQYQANILSGQPVSISPVSVPQIQTAPAFTQAVSAPQPQAQPAPSFQPPAMPTAVQGTAVLPPYEGPVFMDRAASMEFAVGKIGNVLGEFFAPIDEHPTRVRLPDEMLNFVDRVILVEGEKGSMKSGRVVTQHDVKPDAWYLDNNCMPTGMSVEAGQADLFLSAWLGIDFKTKGIAKYRLLDAVVTFHDKLLRPGDRITYDIRVDRFIKQADTYMFFFEFDGSVDGKPLITMRRGCAGFFTDQQLEDGRGIVLKDEDIAPDPRPQLVNRHLLPKMEKRSCDDRAIDLLVQGNLREAFGEEFARVNFPVQTVPQGAMKMLDRITEIDPAGGRFGLGRIKAEFDIPKDPWFLVQHFCDDQVMPGTLMYESCMQSLRVFLLRLGWVGPADRCAFEPVIDVKSQLICRGQVVPGVKKALYDIQIKELGYNPEPYAIADALMFADGKRIVQVLNMSIRLSGITQAEIENFWAGSAQPTAPLSQLAQVTNPYALPALYQKEQIVEYSCGMPSKCFGPEFKPYDEGKFLARLPNPPFLFVDRITDLNADFLQIKPGGTVQGQFDIQPDHWFFRANNQSVIPFSVMLEFPLQVCGWYSCYMGSANSSPEALHYRNLDGTAILYEAPDANSGTLTATVKCTKAANSAGMLIQGFDFLVTQGDRKIYEGDTLFGFFSKEALANQIGLRNPKMYHPSDEELKRAITLPVPFRKPIEPSDTEVLADFDTLNMPARAYTMIDEIPVYVADGGPKGLGYIKGLKHVDTTDWFFKAHFYQDPVIPGSLGLESFMQLLKAAAIHRWGDKLQGRKCRYEPMKLGQKHTWMYRGQVIPTDKLVTVEAYITDILDDELTIMADGFLSVDGRIIYSMENFALKANLE